MLLRSDGTIAACGHNGLGQCSIPVLRSWREWLTSRPAFTQYVQNMLMCSKKAQHVPSKLLQASCSGHWMRFLYLSGEKACEIEVHAQQRLSDIRELLVSELPASHTFIQVDIILPDGELLNKLLMRDPEAVVSSCFHLEELASETLEVVLPGFT